jgi:hypothetical protein
MAHLKIKKSEKWSSTVLRPIDLLSKCHIVHLESDMDWKETELGTLQWEACD